MSLPVSMIIPTPDLARISRAIVNPSAPGMKTSLCLQLHAYRWAVRSGADPISLLREVTRQHSTNPRIAIDDQSGFSAGSSLTLTIGATSYTLLQISA
jgi:hypothetical protein